MDIKECARNYVPMKTLNITDLDRVDLSFPIEDREGMDKDGKAFPYKAMVANGLEYRIPGPVLEQIKKMLELKPDMTHVKVTSTGSGKATRYDVALA